MSVNEVKLTQAAEPFVVLGSGPLSSRTFCLGDEDHTLGNTLRHVLINDKEVQFAGYSVPHPSEPVVQIRVQASPEKDAVDRLQTACHTLSEQCQIVLDKLEALIPQVQEDRLQMEKLVLEYEEEEEDEDENMEDA